MNLTANRCDLYSVTSSKIFPVSEGRRFFRSRYKIWSPSHEMLRAEFFWMPLLYYMSVTNWSICNAIKHGVPRRWGGGGGVGVINKIVSGRLDPVIQILTLRTLHPIYCRKCIVFKIWINDKTKIFFSAFLPPENASVSPFGPFYSTRWQISLAFDVLQLVKSEPFHIPEAWKRYPSRVEPPCTGHYRENSGTGLYPDVRRSI